MMKRNHFPSWLTLCATLLLLAVLLLSGCEETPDAPADTTESDTIGETFPETTFSSPEDTTSAGDPADTTEAATTEAVTTEAVTTTLADRPVGEVLDYIQDQNEDLLQPGTDNFKLEMDMNILVGAEASGVNNSATLPFFLAMTMAGQSQAIKGDILGTTIDVVYHMGTLYMTAAGESVKCPATPEQFEALKDSLGTSDGTDSEFFPADTKPTELFRSLTLEVKDGRIHITGAGLKEQYAEAVAPGVLQLMLSFGLLETDEFGELAEDPEVLTAAIANMLKNQADKDFSVTYIATMDGVLEEQSFNFRFEHDQVRDGVKLTTILGLSGSISLVLGGQTVAAPAGSDTWPEGSFDDFFGEDPDTPDNTTAEELGLVPDAEGWITLSDDVYQRANQLDYLWMHTQNFLDCRFRVTGTLIIYPDLMFEQNGVPMYEGDLLLIDFYEEGEQSASLYIHVNAEVVAPALPEAATEEGMLVNTEGFLALVQDEENDCEYLYFIITSLSINEN